MAGFRLKRFISKDAALRALIAALDPHTTITDTAGGLIVGDAPPLGATAPDSVGQTRVPVQVGAQTVGYVIGGAHPAIIAQVVALAAAHAGETLELADQLLDVYREINLLYTLADTLAAAREPVALARVLVAQVRRVIPVDHVLIVLAPDVPSDSDDSVILPPEEAAFPLPKTLVRWVLAAPKTELIDDVTGDSRWHDVIGLCGALAFTPLKAQGRAVGAILLLHDSHYAYRAADLKLLTAIGAQAAPALDTALMIERTAHESAEREARLQAQIQALRIEIDTARQREKVEAITESAYFRSIRDQRDRLRGLLDDPDG
ncbi:MAG: GAF domain-containing protein [bacterium]|nr:GAF domain-containing protein [bacterium]